MKKIGMKFVAKLTNIGASLQTPIAILPAAGLLLAFGTIFTSQSFLSMMPVMKNPASERIFSVALQCGNIIFSNLPLIFCAGVAIGLTNDAGVAALSSIVGYLIMCVTMGGTLGVNQKMIQSSNAYANILGIPTLQTGVLGGIIIGVMVSYIYNKFYNVKLPTAFAFFAGKRSVPIITAFAGFAMGLILCVIWPPIQSGINWLSDSIANSSAIFAGFMFGFVERLTIPFGMNHIWWPTFWLQAGSYVSKAGQTIHGDQLIFFAQLADNAKITAGTFMNGEFILKMFSMPAAALAMYKCAYPENKKRVAGIMLSGAITAFVAGVTEPLEFLFIFTAPVLFLIHAVITGLGFAIANLVGAHLGLSFSGGFFDYLFFNVLTNRTNWWIIIPVGIVFFGLYYFLFTLAITKFNLKTTGREDKESQESLLEDASQSNDDGLSSSQLIMEIIKNLGGKNNIQNVNACYSRLRVDVGDISLVNKAAFNRLGASGVTAVGNNVQVIYGNKAPAIKDDVLKMINGEKIGDPGLYVEKAKTKSINIENLNHVVSPFTGRYIALKDIPDQVLSNKTLGDGYGVTLTKGKIVAPINGKVTTVFPTKHALGFIDSDGNEVLLHIGIDTVNLKGEGFKIPIKEGDKVTAGQDIAEVDLNVLKDHHLLPISVMIFTNLNKQKYFVYPEKTKGVESGEKGILSIKSIN